MGTESIEQFLARKEAEHGISEQELSAMESRIHLPHQPQADRGQTPVESPNFTNEFMRSAINLGGRVAGGLKGFVEDLPAGMQYINDKSTGTEPFKDIGRGLASDFGASYPEPTSPGQRFARGLGAGAPAIAADIIGGPGAAALVSGVTAGAHEVYDQPATADMGERVIEAAGAGMAPIALPAAVGAAARRAFAPTFDAIGKVGGKPSMRPGQPARGGYFDTAEARTAGTGDRGISKTATRSEAKIAQAIEDRHEQAVANILAEREAAMAAGGGDPKMNVRPVLKTLGEKAKSPKGLVSEEYAGPFMKSRQILDRGVDVEAAPLSPEEAGTAPSPVLPTVNIDLDPALSRVRNWSLDDIKAARDKVSATEAPVPLKSRIEEQAEADAYNEPLLRAGREERAARAQGGAPGGVERRAGPRGAPPAVDAPTENLAGLTARRAKVHEALNQPVPKTMAEHRAQMGFEGPDPEPYQPANPIDAKRLETEVAQDVAKAKKARAAYDDPAVAAAREAQLRGDVPWREFLAHRRAVGKLAGWGKEPTDVQLGRQETYHSLTQAIQDAANAGDPVAIRIRAADKKFAPEMEANNAAAQMMYGPGKRASMLKNETAASKQRGRRTMFRSGEETAAALLNGEELQALRDYDPRAAKAIDEVSAKRAAESIRFGVPNMERGFSASLPVRAVAKNLKAATVRVGIPLMKAAAHAGIGIAAEEGDNEAQRKARRLGGGR